MFIRLRIMFSECSVHFSNFLGDQVRVLVCVIVNYAGKLVCTLHERGTVE